MRNRLFVPGFISFLLLCLYTVAATADAPPLRLWLKDGSYLDGFLQASEQEDLVGFRSHLFRQPLHFDVRAIRSVAGDISSNDQLSDHFYLLEGGTRIAGRLKQWNDNHIVIESPSLGEVRMQRDLLRSIEASEDGGKRVYSGPRSLDDWQLIGDQDNWRFAAGSLTALNKGARAVGDVSMPDKFRLSLAMSWEGRADFVLSLGCNQPPQPKQQPQVPGRRRVAVVNVPNDGAAVRLEMWDAQLAVVREIGNLADIAVLPLDDGISRFEMSFYVDQVAGLVAVYSSRGRLLEKIQVADDKGKPRKYAMLENHGKQVSLDRFDVFSWDGHLPSSSEYPESYVLDTSEKVFRGDIQGFDPQTGMLQLQDQQGEATELALSQLRRVVITPAAGEGVDPEPGGQDTTDAADRSRLIEVEFADSSRVIGTMAASAAGNFVFRAPGVAGDMTCEVGRVVAIIGSETRFTAEDLPGVAGTISGDSVSLKGCLIDNPNPQGDAVLIWRPWASATASPLSASAGGVIRYPKPKRNTQVRVKPAVPIQQPSGLGELLGGIFGGPGVGAKPPAAKQDGKPAASNTKTFEIVFRTGDTVDGVVDQIDDQGVKFQSDETTTKFVAHEKMDSLVLNTTVGRVNFDDDKMKRLMTVPRSMKNDPPTHLFLARTGDYLRGRLLSVDDETVRVEVRLEVKEIPRSKIARIIWLHDRPWLEKEAKGEAGDQEAEQSENADKLFLVHAVRPDKRGVTFQPKKVVDGKLTGESELLGECSVSLDGIESLLFGKDVGLVALKMRKESWQLSLATLPKAYQETADGEGPAMGLQSPLVGREAPGIQLDTIDGDAFDLDQLRGKVVVLDFWASWCGPCIQTMPEVDRIVEELGDEDVRLVAVNLQDSIERARLAVERMQLQATVIMDVDGEAGRYYDARAIPQTVIIGRDGKITHLFVGGGSKFLDQFATALKGVVAGEDAAAAAGEKESS